MKSPGLSLAIVAILFYIGFAGKMPGPCEKKCKTRATRDACDNANSLFVTNVRLARAAGVKQGAALCLFQRNVANKNNNRCSFPSHCHSTSLLPLPERLFEAVDQLGKETSSCYQPGNKWCTCCRKKGEQLQNTRPLHLHVSGAFEERGISQWTLLLFISM